MSYLGSEPILGWCKEVFSLKYSEATGFTNTINSKGEASLSFIGTNASRAGFKIYVASSPLGVHYVGCTCTRMSGRLRLGHLRSIKSEGGYHGYKWRKEVGLQLYVFTLLGLTHPTDKEEDKRINTLVAERIEAELVFAVRADTDQWPLSQHEIHFHNLQNEPALAALTAKIAQQLYKEIKAENALATK